MATGDMDAALGEYQYANGLEAANPYRALGHLYSEMGRDDKLPSLYRTGR